MTISRNFIKKFWQRENQFSSYIPVIIKKCGSFFSFISSITYLFRVEIPLRLDKRFPRLLKFLEKKAVKMASMIISLGQNSSCLFWRDFYGQKVFHLQHLFSWCHTVWTNEKFTLTWKIFRENNLQSNSVINTFISRNFCNKMVMRGNFSNFHTVWCHKS